jgi:hypothetical protein
MQLTTEQSYSLLDKFGVYAGECCDRCGQVLGPERFTRRNESGVWCSRGCRDGEKAHAPRTCKNCKAKLPEGKRRGAMYCDDSCRKSVQRSKTAVQASRTRKLSVTKPSIYAAFSLKKSGDGTKSHPGAFSCVQGEIDRGTPRLEENARN